MSEIDILFLLLKGIGVIYIVGFIIWVIAYLELF